MSGGGKGGWSYAATRAKARRAKLIDSMRYRQMLQQTPNQIVTTIAELGYREEIDLYANRLQGSDLVEAAISHAFDVDIAQVLHFCRGSQRRLASVYASRNEIDKVRIVLRSIAGSIDSDEVGVSILPSENETNGPWLDMIRSSDDFDSAISQLPIGPVKQALSSLPSGTSLRDYEDAIDRSSTRMSLDALKENDAPTRVLRKILRHEVDQRNLANLLRGLRQGLDLETRRGMMLDGGLRFSGLTLSSMAEASDVEGLRSALSGVRGFDHAGFEEALDGVDATNSLDPVMVWARKDRDLMIGRLGHQHPVSAIPVVHYIFSKRGEIANLRLIARGLSAGLSAEKLETRLHI